MMRNSHYFDDNARIHGSQTVKERFREPETDLNPAENLWDVLERTLHGGPTLPSSIQDLAEKFIELWTEVNVVTLHKLIEMIPWPMRAVITAKDGPMKY